MICYAILLLLAVAGFIYLSAVRNSRDKFMKSPYFVQMNNNLYRIQEETMRDDTFRLSAAVILTIRYKEIPL
jgi:hypothetical protein